MQSGSTNFTGRLAIGVAMAALALGACSKKENTDDDAPPAATASGAATTGAATTGAATTSAVAAVPAANVDTVDGTKFASFTGDPAKGKTVFITCQTCHAVEAGVNKIGPSLHNVVGRVASSIPNYQYSQANHNSGITWTKEKLFQYLENPQRIVPGTKMAFAGLPDPQKRADVIAYLAAN